MIRKCDLMIKEQRRQQIMDLLRQYGYVEIHDLCQRYQVTEMTARRDLEYICRQYSNISRKRGGAVMQAESDYEDRATIHMREKLQIARLAVSLVRPYQIVFMDSGTTLTQLARAFPDDSGYIVVTNSIENASELVKKTNVKTVLIGGELDCMVRSTRGIFSEEQIHSLKIDVAFLGANAVNDDGNVYTANTIEISFKKAVLSCSAKSYVLVDSSKIGKNGLLPYVHGSEISGIITDHRINKNDASALRSHSVNLLISSSEKSNT